MQERAGDLAAHALAETELAHRHLEEVSDFELLHQLAQPRAIDARFQFVNVRQKVQTVSRRQVIPELRALTEYRGDAKGQLLPLAPGHQAEEGGIASRGVQDAGRP